MIELPFLFSLMKPGLVIDNMVFRMCTLYSCLAFGFCSLLVTTKMSRSPISCISTLEHGDAINDFCWTQSTFTIPLVNDQIYPGVGSGSENHRNHRSFGARHLRKIAARRRPTTPLPKRQPRKNQTIENGFDDC